MVEKERKKDLRKVVTGGGEGTKKANHREHGGHGEKQTTEGTEDTQKKQTTEDTEDTEVEKRGRTRWSAPTRLGIGLHGGR